MSILFPWYLARENAVATSEFKPFRSTCLPDIVQEYREQCTRFEVQQQKCIKLIEEKCAEEKNIQLLGLKRRISKSKTINFDDIDLEIDTSRELKEYSEVLSKMTKLHNEYLDYYNVSEKEKRENLQQIIGSNNKLLNPLPLINRNFKHKLSKFLQEPTEDHKSKTKKIDFQLSRILSRSTVKTSPFSSFTSVALREWGGEPQDRKIYVARINFYIIQKIIDILAREPGLREITDYRIAPHSVEKQKYLFEVQIDLNRGKIFNNVDKKVSLNVNPLLDNLIRIFENQEYVPYNQIRENLIEYINNEECDKFLNALIGSNILFPNIAVNEYAEYPEEGFLNNLRIYASQNEKASKTLILYEELVELLQKFEKINGLSRFEINDEITNKLTELEQALGNVFQKDLIFYEDYIDDTISVHPRLEEIFSNSCDEIEFMQKLSLLCNTSLEVRLEFAHTFKEKYDDGAIPASNKDVYDMYMSVVNKFTNWTDVLAPVKYLASPLAKKMEKYKAEVKSLFLDAKKNASIAQLDTAKIEALYQDYQKSICVGTDPSTVLFQLDQDDIVLNKIYSGKLRLFLRFFHYYNGIYEDSRFIDYIDKVFPETSVEITEGFGFNANHHRKFIKERLVLGNSREVDINSEHAVFLRDLFFKFDSKEQLVHLYDKSGKKLAGVDVIGSLVDYMLPYSIQILNFNNSPRFDIDYINIWNENRAGLIVDHIPRIKLGNLTISREKWVLKLEHLRNTKQEAERALGLTEYFLREGLPTEFFVKKYIGASNEGIDYATIKRTALKPQYINIRTPLYIKDFLKIVDQNDSIVLEEVYPNIDGYQKNIEYQVEYGGVFSED